MNGFLGSHTGLPRLPAGRGLKSNASWIVFSWDQRILQRQRTSLLVFIFVPLWRGGMPERDAATTGKEPPQ